MIHVSELKAGNQVGFKMTFEHNVLYNSGIITAVQKNTVRIDELLLYTKDLLPILLTNDALVKIGCVQLSSKEWRTADSIKFEFDGLLATFANGDAPVFYLHMFQNTVSRQAERISI